jgi:hypothetical protein
MLIANVLAFLIGLGFGQTANIHLVSNSFIQQLNGSGPPITAPNPCVVQVDFYSANGKLVKSQNVSLAPGQIGRATISQLDLGLFNPHALFWTQANVLNTCGTNANCAASLCAIASTGEVEDALGNTDLVFQGPTVNTPPGSSAPTL